MAPRRNRERIAWGIAAVLALVAVGATFAAWRASRAERPRVMRFSAPNTISARPADTYGIIAISPDGRDIVYAGTAGATRMLFRRAIDAFEVKPIAGTEGAVQPFFSPDGKWIGFFARHKLMKIPLGGGQPIEIARASRSRGGEWLEDDTIVFCPYFYAGIERVPASGGTPAAVSTVDRSAGERMHRWPHPLPGGKVILYTVGFSGSWENAKVVAHNLGTGERKVIINGGCDARYVSSGHLVYVRGTSLHAVPFDIDTLEVRGQPVEVTSGVANHSAGGAEYAFSRNGTLVYFSPGVGGDEGGPPAILNRRGERVAAKLPELVVSNPKFSPDGGSFAAELAWEVWTFDLTRGTRTRITTGARAGWPIWSPDGSRIYYASERSGPWQVYTRAADASDEERRVSSTEESDSPAAMSPDGKEMLVRADRKETGADVHLMTLDGRSRPLLASDSAESAAVFSADGRWIAYESDESGRSEIYVRARNGPGRFQISTEGGREPRWAQHNEIIYLNGSNLMAVPVKAEPQFSVGTPQVLLAGNYAAFDVARDGRILVIGNPDASTSTGRLNVVVNWFEEIRGR
jgi:eukaryotic-like serine/threonine-protein kinase